MGLFGGGRKAAEKAEHDRQMAEINAEMERRTEIGYVEIKDWLDRLEQHRPPGTSTLTDEILRKAGPPPLPAPHEQFPNHGAVLLARGAVRSYAEETLRRTSAHAYTTDLDQSLGSFRSSVRDYLSNIR